MFARYRTLAPRHRLPILAALALVALWLLVPRPGLAQQMIESPDGPLRLETLSTELSHPWGMSFLPDGRLVVTERDGRASIYAEGRLTALGGGPAVIAAGQGGLLDVAASPDFARDGRLFFTYAASVEGGSALRIASYRLDGMTLVDEKILMTGETSGVGNHFGSRLAFGADGTLYATVGDRVRHGVGWPQRLDVMVGKVVRIDPDGGIPKDNPFVGTADARPEIWSYGHRNPQGLAIQPGTGAVFATEHGPQGGDEINRIEPGRNYGWPVVGHGVNYGGAKLHEAASDPAMQEPVRFYVPSTGICGAAFHDGRGVPQWRGSLFVTGLVERSLRRLTLDGDRVASETVILKGAVGRLRDVEVGPDGALYLLTDEDHGGLYRLAPAP